MRNATLRDGASRDCTAEAPPLCNAIRCRLRALRDALSYDQVVHRSRVMNATIGENFATDFLSCGGAESPQRSHIVAAADCAIIARSMTLGGRKYAQHR
jgi:hypothetical protein